jgi:hypothetical protein
MSQFTMFDSARTADLHNPQFGARIRLEPETDYDGPWPDGLSATWKSPTEPESYASAADWPECDEYDGVAYSLTGPDLDQEHQDHEDWLDGYTDVPYACDALRNAKIEANAREDRSSAAYETIRAARSQGTLGLISSAVAWALANDLYPRD